MKCILFHFNPRFLLTLSLITVSGELFARNIFKEKPTIHSSRIEIIKEDGSVDRFEKKSAIDLGNNQFSWTGDNQKRNGFLTFAVIGEKVRGSVLAPPSNFQFKGDLEQQDISFVKTKSRPCGGCRFNAKSAHDPRPRSAAQSKHAWRNADAGLIDLLVVCPLAVQNVIGSNEELLAEINNAVAGANLCFRNSQLQVQLRLVHVYESSYSPTSNLDVDLERLTNKNDGYLDEVHSLRDQYGADVVTLLSTDSDMGGLANTLSYPSLSFEESAFNVCVWDQIGAPVFTLAHEIGHNMGCLHNREDASDSSQSSNYDYGAFAYGKRWYLNGEGYRTVMAYNDSGKNFDNSIPYFSNPSVSYLGVKTGNLGTEDNAKALRISSPYISNFRESKVQGIIPSVFSTDVLEGGTRTVWARLATEPMSETRVNLSLSNQQDFFLGSASSLKFDRNNWNLRQPIQIIGVPDTDTIDESGILTFVNDDFSSIEVTLSGKDSGTDALLSKKYFSGTVVNSFGLGLDGVTLSFSTGESFVQTDLNGTFITTLNDSFSTVVTPSKAGYTFNPSNVAIDNLTDHSLGNIFVGARSTVVYVNHQASGLNNGTSWTDAFTDLSTALELADEYSEIWVAAGTYSPVNIRSGSFVLPGNIQVLGGFKGNENSSSERDFTENQTVLSGNIGDSGVGSDNSFHVVVPLDGANLDGFIIEDGNATENYSDDRGKGGGLWAEGVSFIIRNCEFRYNWAFQGGGGVWLQEVNATFDNCQFTSNKTGRTGSGGAIWSDDSNLTLRSCAFVSNKSGFWGGALRVDDGNLTLSDCVVSSNERRFSNGGGGVYQNAGKFLIERTSFLQNKATHQGGAILLKNGAGSIMDSNFTENHNQSSNGGGALFIENSSPTISSCRFIKNKTDANNYGGAIKLAGSNSKVINCIFKYNQNTKNSGGALYIDQSSNPELEDNEFHYNFSASRGGAIFCESKELSLINGLFLGNWAKNGGGVATYGTTYSSFINLKILGNEANASSQGSGGFLNLGSGSANSKFINCIIAGNKSNYRDGVYSPNGVTRFLHCTIVGNKAGAEGGVTLMFSTDSVELENSIMWQNTAPKANDIWVNAGQAFANYSLFDPARSEGDITGVSNINQDPLFFDLEGADKFIGTLDDDLRLLLSSPAKDVGNPEAMELPPNDIVGVSREGLPDLGAYEYFENSTPVYLGESDFNIYEGNSSITIIKASDADGHPLFFSIIGGKDQGRISVGSENGILYFNASPDYEYPEDSDGDNKYEILLSISDGYTSLQLKVTINLLDVDETAKSPEDSNLLINGYSIGNNWNQASWFGTYYSQYFPWVYHSSMGWLFIVQDQAGDAWMWKESLGWLWTDLGVFPYFFIQSIQDWGYSGSDSRSGQYYLFETGNSGWKDL
jgi:predicted outer membrane repeat protein